MDNGSGGRTGSPAPIRSTWQPQGGPTPSNPGLNTTKADYQCNLYMDSGPYLTFPVANLTQKCFYRLEAESTTMDMLLQLPEKTVTQDGISVKLYMHKKLSVTDVVILPYNVSDIRTFAVLQETFRWPEPPAGTLYILAGFYDFPESEFSIKWPKHFSKGSGPVIKKKIESVYGTKPWKVGGERQVSAQEARKLAQQYGAPWLELSLDDIEDLWKLVHRMVLFKFQKPVPTQEISANLIAFSLVGQRGKSGNSNGSHPTLSEPRTTATYDKSLLICDSGNHSIRAGIMDGGGVSSMVNIAGNGKSGDSDGNVTSSRLNHPTGVIVAKDGSILMVDCKNHKIKAIANFNINTCLGTPCITTFAGTGVPGFKDGPYLFAQFNFPSVIEYYTGNTYLVADSMNNVIRLLKDGAVLTFAGDGSPRLHDGLLLDAAFQVPQGIRSSTLGNLIVSDTLNNCIRRITKGLVTTIAGNGKLRFADGPALQARFYEPTDAIEFGNGDILIVDRGNDRIRILRNEIVSTVAGSYANVNSEGLLSQIKLCVPTTLALTKDGDLILTDVDHHQVLYISRPFLGSNEGLLHGNWKSFDPISKIAVDPTRPAGTDYAIPEIMLLQSYLLNPSSLVQFVIDWLKRRLVMNAKELGRWMSGASSRIYIRDKYLQISDHNFGDICSSSTILTSNTYGFANMNTQPGEENVFTFILTNNSKLPAIWKLKNALSTLSGCICYMAPIRGTLNPFEAVTVNIVGVLLSRAELQEILRIEVVVHSMPILTYTALHLQLSCPSLAPSAKKNVAKSSNAFAVASPPDYWIIHSEMLGPLSRLGSGAAATVFKTELYGLPVALKRWDVGTRDPPPDEFVSELKTYVNVHHNKLIKFLGAKSAPGCAWIVTELAGHGSLDVFLKDATPAEKCWENKLQMAIDGASGLQFLHDNNLIHRDVKSLNFLVTDDFEVRVADFGTTKQASTTLTQGVGSIDWMAPEVFRSQKYTYKTDVFSFGLVLLEFLLEHFPNRNFEHVADGAIPVIEPEFRTKYPSYCNLIDLCCATEPQKRPTFSEIVQSLKAIQRSTTDRGIKEVIVEQRSEAGIGARRTWTTARTPPTLLHSSRDDRSASSSTPPSSGRILLSDSSPMSLPQSSFLSGHLANTSKADGSQLPGTYASSSSSSASSSTHFNIRGATPPPDNTLGYKQISAPGGPKSPVWAPTSNPPASWSGSRAQQ